MILTALARLGKDATLRQTASGEPVASLALAINYGRKGDDGNRPTQWLDASLWGKRAEALAQHLTKGKLLYVVIEEPHIETFQGANGQGHKLVGRISSIEFAGGNERQQSERQQSEPQQRSQPAQRQQQKPQDRDSGGGFGAFDDDIPFLHIGSGASWRVI